MAKVILRKYIRDIESQVDHGQIDEAIAHCRHILRKYPKHLDTYRMLGKAYLEARRYNEATDIFHRLLMAVPDDFVAHVGMSIINDVQQDMDASIWHMERAFEVQPSNSAIQAELQRLYSRRDGVEPPKIRLTRGALSHMYVQGELYPQAISEITNVLGADPGRQDMQVLLALAYFHAGQKNESAEICAQLIHRYPYCLDANRVLVELLPEGEESKDAQVYRSRVIEMDPYTTFVTGSIFRSEDVPDEAVSIERLVWDGQPVEVEPGWESSLGIGLAAGGAVMNGQPAWLKSAVADDMIASSLPDESGSASGESPDIPEFLRDAGFGVSTGKAQEGSTLSGGEPEPALAEGDLPDWVRAMAPQGVDRAAPAPAEQPSEEAGAPAWLDSLQAAGSEFGTPAPARPEAGEEQGLPAWLTSAEKETGGPPAAAEAPPHAEDIPKWLGAMQAGEGAEKPVERPSSSEEKPERLDSLQSTDERETAPLDKPRIKRDQPEWLDELPPEDGRKTAPLEKPETKQKKPAWLESLETESAQAESPAEGPPVEAGKPDRLEAMKPEGAQAEFPSGQAEPEEETPDWLQSLGAGSIGSAGQEAAKLDDSDVPDWLKADSTAEEPAAKPVSPEAEPVAQPGTPEGEPVLDEQVMAGWLDELEQGPAEGAEPAVYDKIDTGSLGKSETEQDQALSWLEGLAAKHGAKSEELLTKPDERAESEPEWVQKAKTLGGEPVMKTDQPEEFGQEPALPVGEQESPIKEQLPSSGAPVSGVKEIETADLGLTLEEQDEALSWLEGLAAGQGAKPEELLTKPEERRTSEPDWVTQAKAAEAAGAEGTKAPRPADAGAPESFTADQTGMFLRSLEKEGEPGEQMPDLAAASAEAAEDEVFDWMKDLSETGLVEGSAAVPVPEEGLAAIEPGMEMPEMPADQSAPSETMEAEGEPAAAEEKRVEDLPEWLAGLDEEPQGKPSAAPEGVPEWLAKAEETGTAKPAPVQPSDWQPADELAAEQAPPQQEVEPSQAPRAEGPAAEPGVAARPKKTGDLSETNDPVLIAAQNELKRGNIPGAVDGYSKLIKKGNLLDEVIFDLRGALQRYPVESTIWQALGDAYMRANRLQEALDAYTKAEEMLR